MIEAIIHLKKGGQKQIFAKDWPDLLNQIKSLEIIGIMARDTRTQDNKEEATPWKS